MTSNEASINQLETATDALEQPDVDNEGAQTARVILKLVNSTQNALLKLSELDRKKFLSILRVLNEE